MEAWVKGTFMEMICHTVCLCRLAGSADADIGIILSYFWKAILMSSSDFDFDRETLWGIKIDFVLKMDPSEIVTYDERLQIMFSNRSDTDGQTTGPNRLS